MASRTSATTSKGPAASRRLSSYGMRVPQGGQDERDDLVRAASRRVDREVRPPVIGPAQPVELLDLVAGPPVHHGPVTDPASPLEELAHVAVEPDHCAQLAEALHPPLAAWEAPSGRDDVARLQRQGVERLGLELAESLLTRVAEDLGDRPALARHDHVVGLHETAPEPARQEPSADRFSGAHESNEYHVVAPHLRILSDRGSGQNATPGPADASGSAPRAAAGLGAPPAEARPMIYVRSSGRVSGGKRSRASNTAHTG